MKKTLLALLLVGLLLVSTTACSGGSAEGESGSETESTTVSQDHGNDPLGSGTNEESTPDDGPTNPADDISEIDPVVNEISMNIYVFANSKVRSTTIVDKTDANYITTAYVGATFEVTGETQNWYQIIVKGEEGAEDKTGYISKNLVGDKALIDAFEECDPETVTVTGAQSVNFRSFPSSGSDYSICGQLKEGDVVTRVAIGDGWSRISYQAKNDEEPKSYYISSAYLAAEEAESGTEDESATTAPEGN